ncbi:MAG: hypothetical protein K6F37_09265 [Lachnospiraceae bacterium]|nr:hypothetical protein [Lachnospiraceae bacterium]
MNILSRDFNTREKVLILILVVILLALGYYWLVDSPVRTGIYEAKTEKEALEVELNAVNKKIDGLKHMQEELDDLGTTGRAGYMASYNNSKAELAALNNILSNTDEYVISFAELTREGELVRRAFSIQFTTSGYTAAKKTITELENSEYRCRIGDLNCVAETSNDENTDLKHWTGKITVTATATFYETMVGGVEDEGLPEDSSTEQK